MKLNNYKVFTTFVCTVSLALFAQFSQANTITIVDDLGFPLEKNGKGFSVTCDGGCSGFIGLAPASTSLVAAEGYALPSSSLENEMAFLEALTGGAFTGLYDGLGNGINAMKHDVEAHDFLTVATWFSIKKDGWTGFFMNDGGLVDVSFFQDGDAGTYSHWTAYGPGFDSDVPLPAAAWLFGSALLGLGVVKRRKA